MRSYKLLSDQDRNNGYLDYADIDNANPKVEPAIVGYELSLDALTESVRTAEIEEAKVQEAKVLAHQRIINSILVEHQFLNRIDLQHGITATVALFEYQGHHPRIKELERCGYVMVKLPPFAGSTNLHAQETYENEIEIVEEIAHIKRKTRPLLLVLRMGGIRFILNAPIFFDEPSFCQMRDAMLSEHKLLLEAGESRLDLRYEFEEFVRSHFFNLSSYMKLLGQSGVDPQDIMDVFYCSMLDAVIELNDDGVLHCDLAGRNFVGTRDGAALLVDLGMGAMMFKVSHRSRTNRRFSSVSLMHNYDALKRENHIIDVVTDYVSLQKTMLELIADYLGIDFYKMCVEGLDRRSALRVSNTAILAEYPDQYVICNLILNIKEQALAKAEAGIPNGEYALKIIEKYHQYFMHTHDRNLSYAQLREANIAKFYQCTRRKRTYQPRDAVAQVVNHLATQKEKNETREKVIPEVTKGTVSAAVKKFGFIERLANAKDNSCVNLKLRGSIQPTSK